MVFKAISGNAGLPLYVSPVLDYSVEENDETY